MPTPSHAGPTSAPGLRALLVGAVGSVAIGAGVPYCNMVLHGSRIASYFNTPAAIILFFFLVLFVNTAIGLLRRDWMLRRAELALVYIMWIVATAIPEWGLTAFLLPDITSLIYYATPENAWNDHLLPSVPDWIIPHHEMEAVRSFYEGAPEGRGIPWGLWLRPLAWWLPFILALYVAMICVMAILQKQWVDRERLVYPLVQVPLSMIEEDEGERPSLIKPFFRNRLMWIGFLVPTGGARSLPLPDPSRHGCVLERRSWFDLRGLLMRGSQPDSKPAPGLVASALALGVAAGAGAEVAPMNREHEQVVTRARQAYQIDMGGTMDGANTRDPVGYGVYGQEWEPNRYVLMENVGDDDVANPWILVDGRRDWRSVDHILSGIIEPGMAEGEKARAIWDFARRHRYHSTPGTDEVKDTVKMLNVYGYTLCWDAAYTMSNLWQRAGLKIRRGLPHGHCTTEVFYDGAYHLLDSDEHLLVLMRDNRTVAGEAEISRDHDLMKRSHAYGILRAEDRRTNEFSASLFCYLGPRSGGRPYIGGHRMEITLRPGEGLRWEWADRGRYHGLGDRPPRLANGRLHYRPRLDSGFARWTESSSNLEGGGGGLRVLDPGEEASVVYRLRSPYVFVGGRARVQLASGSGAWRLELAREGQDDWTHLADVPADGEFSLDGGFPRPTACYEYRLRLRGSGGGIASLEIESDLQMAPLSLPALEVGANEIVYTDETPGPRRVRVVHAWQEREDLTPPPAPDRALHPPAGGEVPGTQTRFAWEPVPEAVDYHFELSRHADMRRTLSPVFEKLSSRTPSAGQAHWQIPFEGLLNPGETCYWRVRARNAGGLWGPWSEVWRFSPRAPGVPRDLKLVTDREARSISLHWRPAAEGTTPHRYEVYGSDERGFTASADSYAVFTGGSGARNTPGNRLATTGDTSIVVAGPGLAPEAGNRGFYRVVAVDAEGIRSGPSDYVEATRPFIYSTPPVSIAAGERRLYRVGVIRSMGDLRSITDPEKQGDPGAGGRYQAAFRDGDELRFVLDEGPGFIALDRETGVMTLAPSAADVSTHTVTIRVQNRNGGVDVQGWDLRVADAPPVAEPVP